MTDFPQPKTLEALTGRLPHIRQPPPQPHTGCGKFSARFGVDALKFVNSPEGRVLGLRGVNAKVITPGRVRAGDPVRKLQSGG